MRHAGSEREHRRALAAAVRSTLAAGSARVRYATEANPAELVDAESGEGVASFRDRTSRVTHSIGIGAEHAHPDVSAAGQVEQIIYRDTSYIRFDRPDGTWEELPHGDRRALGSTGDASGYLDLLEQPAAVTLVADDDIDGRPARRYELVVKPPRSTLRTGLALGSRTRAPKRFWVVAWVDANGCVRRVTASNRAPRPDGSLPRGTVRTTVEFHELGTSEAVEIPPHITS